MYLQKTCKTRTSSTAQSLGTCSRRRRCPRVRAITPPASRQRDGRQRAEHAAGAPREASAPGGTARGSRSPTLPQERCGEAKQPPRTDTSPASTADRSRGWCPVPRATASEQRPLNSSPVPLCWKTKQRSLYKHLQYTNNSLRIGKVRNRMGEIFMVQKSHKQRVFRLHKELLKFSNTTNHPLKMAKQALRREDVGMANDHVRRCSLLFGTQYTPTRQLTDRQSQVGQGYRATELLHTAGHDTNSAAVLEKSASQYAAAPPLRRLGTRKGSDCPHKLSFTSVHGTVTRDRSYWKPPGRLATGERTSHWWHVQARDSFPDTAQRSQESQTSNMDESQKRVDNKKPGRRVDTA